MNTINVEWEFEDELPPTMSKEQYGKAFEHSKIIGGVRMFPYVVGFDDNEDTERYYLL